MPSLNWSGGEHEEKPSAKGDPGEIPTESLHVGGIDADEQYGMDARAFLRSNNMKKTQDEWSEEARKKAAEARKGALTGNSPVAGASGGAHSHTSLERKVAKAQGISRSEAVARLKATAEKHA